MLNEMHTLEEKNPVGTPGRGIYWTIKRSMVLQGNRNKWDWAIMSRALRELEANTSLADSPRMSSIHLVYEKEDGEIA